MVCSLRVFRQKVRSLRICRLRCACHTLRPQIRLDLYTLAVCHSLSIVSDYDQAIQVRSPAKARGFLSLASVSRPALRLTDPPVKWVPVFLSSGVKRSRGVTLTTHRHLVPRPWISTSYTSSPPCTSIGVLWDWCTFTAISKCPNSEVLFATFIAVIIFLCSLVARSERVLSVPCVYF
jgi:hypothetical protein